MIDVEPVQNHVEHHGIVVLLDERGYRRFEIEGARAAQEIIHPLRAVLEGELYVIEPGFLERVQARAVQAHTGRDEVRVEAETMRLRHDGLEIVPGQRFTAAQTQLHRAEGPRLPQYPQPIVRTQFGGGAREVRGVVAENTVQGAPVSELQQEPQRRPGLGRRIHGLRRRWC